MTEHYTTQTLQSILGQWWIDAAAATVAPHSSSGLSGALIWRVIHRGQSFCLRRWPQEHPSAADLVVIHGLLRHVARQGIDFVPVPLGCTVADGHLWELAPWMPGEAFDRAQSSRECLLEAARRLAQLHIAASSYGDAIFGAAPGLVSRRKGLRELYSGGFARLGQAIETDPAISWDAELRAMLSEMKRSVPAVLGRIEAFADAPLPLQWCVRDVKHDHVLFERDRLIGLIDFGAAAIDSVAGDIARLLGGMVGDDRAMWSPAIDAYHSVRPLSHDERRAIELFDQGGTLAASANWLRWLLIEHRQFTNRGAVGNQLQWLLSRLRAL